MLQEKTKKFSPNEDDNTYIVEKILKKGYDKDYNVYYKIKWKHLPFAESTWEKIENCENIKDLINSFEKNLINKYKKFMKIPQKILHIKLYQKIPYLLIKWKNNNENIKIPNTYVKYNEIRKKFPNLLFDYFENKLKVNNKKISFININESEINFENDDENINENNNEKNKNEKNNENNNEKNENNEKNNENNNENNEKNINNNNEK